MRLAIIGVPYSSAGHTSGEARAPDALREAGLLEALQVSHDVADYGNTPPLTPSPHRDPVTGVIAPDALVAMVNAVREAVTRALSDGRLPVVVGGECPLLLGSLAAARDAYGRVGLLFVDGHEDAWAPHQSPTGEAADMELGLALGLTTVALPGLANMLPIVRPADTIVLGPRDRADLDAEGAPSIMSQTTSLNDVALRNGDPSAEATAFAQHLHRDAGHWWFHVDLDVLSTEAMPAVRYPQAGGLEWADLEAITAVALHAPGLIGWDVTIYNPDLDPERRAAARIVTYLAGMLAPVP